MYIYIYIYVLIYIHIYIYIYIYIYFYIDSTRKKRELWKYILRVNVFMIEEREKKKNVVI